MLGFSFVCQNAIGVTVLIFKVPGFYVFSPLQNTVFSHSFLISKKTEHLHFQHTSYYPSRGRSVARSGGRPNDQAGARSIQRSCFRPTSRSSERSMDQSSTLVLGRLIEEASKPLHDGALERTNGRSTDRAIDRQVHCREETWPT